MHEAKYWQLLDDHRVECRLCHQHCRIQPDTTGLCGVRWNNDGHLQALNYARPAARAVDPIEKKPLYHFLPGTRAYSLGTSGCNFRCLHCQNCEISQVAEGLQPSRCPRVEPDEVVNQALATGCSSIAYTYTEPTIFLEYAQDTARLGHEAGLKNIFVTNGYIMAEPLRDTAPYLDAANIDLKFFRDDHYRKVCGARLQPVLDSIRLYHELGIWIELTTLVIPGYNDDAEQLQALAGFIAELDPRIPWHVTAFHPTYKLQDVTATPREALLQAQAVGTEAGLKHIYLGNIIGKSETYCPECHAVVLSRGIDGSGANQIEDGCCPQCGSVVAGVWTSPEVTVPRP